MGLGSSPGATTYKLWDSEPCVLIGKRGANIVAGMHGLNEKCSVSANKDLHHYASVF